MSPKARIEFVGMHVSMCVCRQQEIFPFEYVGDFSSFQEAPERSKEARCVEQASQNVIGRCLMLFTPRDW